MQGIDVAYEFMERKIVWSRQFRLLMTTSLRSYAFLRCIAFPQITQITACYILGLRRIRRMRILEVVAVATCDVDVPTYSF
jgi:hypothetical protein